MDDREAATEHLAVLGSPIAHSKSPAIHAAAYRELGLAWSYGREELRADRLDDFLGDHLRGWRGFSLTMPLKEEAYRLAAILDPVAEESGVVNTLLRLDSEAQQWAGFNTDVAGLAAAVRGCDLDASRTVVLGAGATAVSAVLAARSLGAARITVAARRAEAARALADRFDAEAAVLGAPEAARLPREATLVISTLPGTAGAEAQLPVGLTAVPLFDVAYDPWPSPLAARWRASGGAAHAGVAMLIEQALLQIRIFVNGDPNRPLEGEERVLAAMRSAARTP
ncbi:MAG: shikimate dehydrogenase family protein [Leucobacter sp.]